MPQMPPLLEPEAAQLPGLNELDAAKEWVMFALHAAGTLVSLASGSKPSIARGDAGQGFVHLNAGLRIEQHVIVQAVPFQCFLNAGQALGHPPVRPS